MTWSFLYYLEIKAKKKIAKSNKRIEIKSGFQSSVERNYAIALVLHCYGFSLAKKSRATFSTNQK